MNTLKKIYVIFLILAMICSLVLIFSNSMKSKTDSQSQSDEATEMIGKVLNDNNTDKSDFWGKVVNFLKLHVRKVAHFVEFFIFGIELSLMFYTVLKKDGLQTFVNMLFIATVVAIIDETIQIFSNRGPLVQDVVLDSVSSLIAISIVLLIKNLIKKKSAS